jgi:hypothetical protein
LYVNVHSSIIQSFISQKTENNSTVNWWVGNINKMWPTHEMESMGGVVILLLFFWEQTSLCSLAILELSNPRPQPPECWDYRCVSPHRNSHNKRK